MNSEQDLFNFLTNCGRLRRLTTVLDPRGLTMAIKSLPTTLEYLWIHYVSWSLPFISDVEQDKCIVQTIRTVPKLARLTIAISPRGLQGEGNVLELVFEQTVAYCAENSVELVMLLDGAGLPPFE